MARIKKYAPTLPQNLTTYQTFLIDSKLESTYFKVSEFRDTFSGGKNGFLLEGSEHLKETTEIQIQILDAFGNPVYYEPGSGIPEYYEGVSKPISVHIYNDTPVGNSKITILGELKTYVDSGGVVRDIPVEWRGVYNVKWEREFKINKTLANDHRVRFVEKPEIEVTELSGSVYQVQIAEFKNVGVLSGIPITPSEGTVLPNKYYGDILFRLTKSGSSEIQIPLEATEPPYWENTRTPLPVGKYYQLRNCATGQENFFTRDTELIQVYLYGGGGVIDCSNIRNIKLQTDYEIDNIPGSNEYTIIGTTNNDTTSGFTLAGPFTPVVENNELVYGCSGGMTARNLCNVYDPNYTEPQPTPGPIPTPGEPGSFISVSDYGIFPTGSVLSPVITIPSASIFDEPIDRFLNNTQLLIRKANLDEFNAVKAFDGYEYEIKYTSIVNQVTSSLLSSYGFFKLDKLTTFIGDVGRVKVFYRPTLSITDFVLIDDIPIESVELLRKPVSGSFYNYGNFRPDYEEYWEVLDSVEYTVTQSDDYIYDGLIISPVDPNDRPEDPFIITTIDEFTMVRNQEYTFAVNLQYSGLYNTGSYFRAYLTGSSAKSDYQEIFYRDAIPQYTVQKSLNENFIVREDGDYRLVIETYGYRWDYGGVSLRTASDTAFSPDYMQFVLTIPRTLPEETFDFKFQFYDINNNYIPVDLFARRITFREGSGSVPVTEDTLYQVIQLIQNEVNNIYETIYDYSGNGGHIIQNNGTPLPQRANLNFVRLIVFDDPANNATVVVRPPSVVVAPTPPTQQLLEGDEWISTITWKKYIWYEGYWVETGKVDCNNYINEITPSSTFLQLFDTPSSYVGSEGYVVTVNGTANGLTFVPPSFDSGFDIPPVHISYQSTIDMVLGQSTHVSGYIYYDGKDYWEYLGGRESTILNYRKISQDGIQNIDGGFANSTYLLQQNISGGGA